VININQKGMISSCVLKNKILIGCKDGTVYEIRTDTYQIEKSYEATTAATAIEYLNEFLADSFVISQ